MANYTKNYHLKKPLPEEYFNVEDQNGNMDILDTALASHEVDKNNPHAVTAAQIGAASAAEHNIRTYTSLEQLGLSDANFEGKTFDEAMELLIATKMPAFSKLNLFLNDNDVNGSPILAAIVSAKISEDLGESLSVGQSMNFFMEKGSGPSLGMPIEVYFDSNIFHGTAAKCMFDRDGGTPVSTKFNYSFRPEGFLPLSGGKMSAIRIYPGDGYGSIYAKQDVNFSIGHLKTERTDHGGRFLVLRHTGLVSLEKGVQYASFTEEGVKNYYNLYGEHNITAGTADLTAGTSALTTGCIYQVYK